jgi:putative DNA-invertase from lambdoid prophage Rac
MWPRRLGAPTEPWPSREQFKTVVAMLDGGADRISTIARTANISRQTVYRIKDDRAAMEAALAAWGT